MLSFTQENQNESFCVLTIFWMSINILVFSSWFLLISSSRFEFEFDFDRIDFFYSVSVHIGDLCVKLCAIDDNS